MVGDVTMDWDLPERTVCIMPSRHGIVVLTLSQRSSLCTGAQERGAPHASAASAVKTAHLLVLRRQALAAARPLFTGWRLPQAAFPEPGVKNFRIVVIVPKARPGAGRACWVRQAGAAAGERVAVGRRARGLVARRPHTVGMLGKCLQRQEADKLHLLRCGLVGRGRRAWGCLRLSARPLQAGHGLA